MTPIAYRREGDVLRPLPRFHNEFAASFEDGKVCRLAEIEERSQKSHSHYFAAIHDGWANLPEEYGQEFASAEHLRKWCLIKAGFNDRRSIVCASKAEAQRVAAFVRPLDEFAVVTVSEATVTIYTAKSQSMRAMGKDEFQRSKTAVLDLIDDMLGVTRGETAANAGQAA